MNKVSCFILFSFFPLFSYPISERVAASERQRVKILNKKAEAELQRRKAEHTIYLRQQQVQVARSAVFAAACKGDAKGVEKGVWENEVDAAGGEVKDGCQIFVEDPPKDLQETLLHIAARKGDHNLVRWLDGHGKSFQSRASLCSSSAP